MQGSDIFVTSNPLGVYIEGTISGTPKPGTVMQIKAATEPSLGLFTWEVFNADSDGDQRLIAILLEDKLQGKTYSDAYVTGSHGYLYIPIAGEQFNMLVAATGTGTGDTQAIGALYIVEDATGLLIATTGTPESEPFICLETQTDVVAAGTLTRVMFTGY